MTQRARNPAARQPVMRRVPRRDFPRARWHGGLMFGENPTTEARATEDGTDRITEDGVGRRVEE